MTLSYRNFKAFVVRDERHCSKGGESNSSNSTLSDSGIKRRKKLDYLRGDGEFEWAPQTRLIVKDFDVTEFQKKYRKRNLKIAKKVNDLSNLKLLSLSFIFLVDRYDESKCVTKHLNEDIAKEFQKIAYNDIHVAKSSDEAVLYCKKISDREDTEYKPINEMDMKVKACSGHLISNKFYVQHSRRLRNLLHVQVSDAVHQ